jgi:hypothetical protein
MGMCGGFVDSAISHKKHLLGTSDKAQQASVDISIWHTCKRGVTIYKSTH